jgi:hypothetical protein
MVVLLWYVLLTLAGAPVVSVLLVFLLVFRAATGRRIGVDSPRFLSVEQRVEHPRRKRLYGVRNLRDPRCN